MLEAGWGKASTPIKVSNISFRNKSWEASDAAQDNVKEPEQISLFNNLRIVTEHKFINLALQGWESHCAENTVTNLPVQWSCVLEKRWVKGGKSRKGDYFFHLSCVESECVAGLALLLISNVIPHQRETNLEPCRLSHLSRLPLHRSSLIDQMSAR